MVTTCGIVSDSLKVLKLLCFISKTHDSWLLLLGHHALVWVFFLVLQAQLYVRSAC